MRALLRFNKARADRDYAEAFRDQGLGEPPNDPEEAAARVRASRWAAHLVAALDDWAVCAADPARQDWLLGVAHAGGPRPLARPGARPGGLERWKGPGRAGAGGPAGGAARPAAAGAGRTAVRDRGRRGRLSPTRPGSNIPRTSGPTLRWPWHCTARKGARGVTPRRRLAYYEKALEIRPQAVAVLNDFGVVLYDRYWMWDNERDGGGPGPLPSFIRW